MSNRPALTRPALITALLLTLTAALLIALPAGHAQAAVSCTKYAAIDGSDSASGTADRPLRSAQQLADSLSAGQTGCLKAGSYGGVVFRHGGTSGAPLTLRSVPGEKATLNGLVEVHKGAPNVTVESLYLDGKGASQPSPTVNDSGATFRDNDVTNQHTNICFVLGDSNGVWGRADGAVIASNRIHDCGKLPRTNFQHGIYVEGATGARIEGNWIYGNADYGVHMYPDAQRTVVRGNVIDGNGMGMIFAGDGGQSSNDNVVEGNAITNSTSRYNVEAWWSSGNPAPHGNVVRSNCFQGGAMGSSNGGIDSVAGGILSMTANRIAAGSQYVNRASGDLRLTAGGTCRATFAGNPDAVPGPDGTPTASSPAPAPVKPVKPTPAPAQPAPTPAKPAPAKPAKPVARKHRRKSSIGLSISKAKKGRVVLRGTVSSAGRRARTLKIQVAGRRGWRTVTSARVAGSGRFAAVVSSHTVRGKRVRAVAPGVAQSASVRPGATA